jgi:hypothetical protein
MIQSSFAAVIVAVRALSYSIRNEIYRWLRIFLGNVAESLQPERAVEWAVGFQAMA